MTDFIQVSTMVDTKTRASRIAQTLLRDRLASCVQVLGPIDSSYWWKDRIEHSKEWLLIIKARKSDYHGIESAIKKAHSYEVPEVLAFTVLRGNPDYLRWMRNETTRKRKQ